VLHAIQFSRAVAVSLLAALLLVGCLSSGPRHADWQDAGPDSIDDRRAAVLHNASAQLGTPYRYGGNRPGGFDCSGLVEFSHQQAGIRVPRTTREQWRRSSPLPRNHLVPGDLVFFSLGGDKPHHVGIYAGDGLFIHAPSAGKRVGHASLDNPYWKQRWIGSRTFL
jgi:cell wall-associated NlpC family hydrolase